MPLSRSPSNVRPPWVTHYDPWHRRDACAYALVVCVRVLYAVMYIHVHVHISTRAQRRGRARTRVRRVRRCRLKGNLRARGLPPGGGGDTNGSLNSTTKIHTRVGRSCDPPRGLSRNFNRGFRRNRLTHYKHYACDTSQSNSTVAREQQQCITC